MNDDRTKNIIEMMLLGQLIAAKIDESGARGWLLKKVKMQSNALVRTLEADLKQLYMATMSNDEASQAYVSALRSVDRVFEQLRSIPIEDWASVGDILEAAKTEGE